MWWFKQEPHVPNPNPRTSTKWDIIEPVGKRVVIRKDDNKRETKSGIVLPGNHEIPTLTGRVIAISKQIERDQEGHDTPCHEMTQAVHASPRSCEPGRPAGRVTSLEWPPVGVHLFPT